jgi:hypothetical protein
MVYEGHMAAIIALLVGAFTDSAPADDVSVGKARPEHAGVVEPEQPTSTQLGYLKKLEELAGPQGVWVEWRQKAH